MKLITKRIIKLEAIREKRKKGQCKFYQNIIDEVVDKEIKAMNNLLTVENIN